MHSAYLNGPEKQIWSMLRANPPVPIAPIISVSHYSAIGDTISCNAPCSAIGFRGRLFCDSPLQGLSLDCDTPFLLKEMGV